MPITINEDFLRHAFAVLDRISFDAPASPGEPMDGLPIHSGFQNFATGQQLSQVIRTTAGGIQSLLQELSKTAGSRSDQIRQFLLMSDDVEDLNDMTALEFLQSLPAWNTGGSTT